MHYLCIPMIVLSCLVFSQEEFVWSDDGVGSRGIAMGGAQTAVANDFSAVYWNPACLTNIRLHEIALSAAYVSLSDASEYSGMGPYDAHLSDIKLQSIGYVYPFPTLRGSLVFAAGYCRPRFLHYTQQLPVHPDYTLSNSSSVIETFDAKGHVGKWYLSAATDISEDISIGAGLYINSGKDEALAEYSGIIGDSAFQYDESSDIGDFFGFGCNLGLAVDITKHIKAGLSTVVYNNINAERNPEAFLNGQKVGEGKREFSLVQPLVFRAGIAYNTLPLCLSLDACYTHWEGAQYYENGSNTPQSIDDVQNTVDLAVGLEYLLPLPLEKAPGIKLRGGFAHYQIPFSNYKSDLGSNAVSGGIGLLLDKVLLVEITGRYSDVALDYFTEQGVAVTETVTAKTAFFSVSYRY